MRGLALNVLLAFIWALFAGELSSRNFMVGFLAGLILLRFFPAALGAQSYLGRLRGLGRFTGFFLRELGVANVQVALLALAPQPDLNARILAVPLRVRTEFGITLLTAAITLLPGTVALGLSRDRRTLYAHAIGSSEAAMRQGIVDVEDRLLEFLEPRPATLKR